MDSKTTMQISEEDLKAMRKLIGGSKKGTDPEKFHDLVYRFKKEIIDPTQTPDFLFSGRGTNKEIYLYLKENPKSAQFVYDNYPENQAFIRTLCDERNSSLYLPKVAKELNLTVEIKSFEDQLSTLKRAVEEKQRERNSLVESITPMEQKYDELEKNLKSKKVELESLETQVTNLHGTEGLDKVKTFISNVSNFIQETYDYSENKKLSNLNGAYATFTIDKEKFHALLDESEKLDLYLKADQFTQEDITNSKTELAKGREYIRSQIQQALIELESVKYMKPTKKLELIVSKLFEILRAMERIETANKGTGREYVRMEWLGFNAIRENLSNAIRTASDFYNQLENKDKAENEEGTEGKIKGKIKAKAEVE